MHLGFLMNILHQLGQLNLLLCSVCMNEINFLFHITRVYFKYVKECIGVDVWEHKLDYYYWIDLEKSDSHTLDGYSVPYLRKKTDLIESIVRNWGHPTKI